MRKVNNEAKKVLDHLADLAAANDGHIKLDNGGECIMAVCVEHIGPGLLSVAHYGEMNGDLMRDPDMVFYRYSEGGDWFPVSYRNDYAGTDEEAIIFRAGEPYKFSRRRQTSMAVFAATWMQNIAWQQELKIKPVAEQAA